MEDYVLQQGLPAHFKNNAIVLDKIGFIYRAWRYKEARELIEWIKSNDYIISGIQVIPPADAEMKYLGHSWHYHGDRNKSKAENIAANFLESLQFIDNIHSTLSVDLVYAIHFHSEKNMNEITRYFYYKSILNSGYNYEMEDALEIIGRCRIEGKIISGIEVFKITATSIQPMDMMSFQGNEEELEPSLYYEYFHIKKNNDSGNWDKAGQFIKERAFLGYYFQIAYH